MGPTQKLNFKLLQVEVHQNAVNKGFWSPHANVPSIIKTVQLSLIASEVYEAIDAVRSGSPSSELGPELADIVIRTLDFAEGYGLDLGEAIEKKMLKNQDRPKMHGKLF